MQPQRDLAIVLKSVLYEERHRIVTAITHQNGLISALAKNSVQSRRFGGTLELFTAADWIFTTRPGAELHQLTEAQIREPFEKIRKDFHKLAVASTFSELLIRVTPPNESSPELFRLHSNALTALNEEKGGDDLFLLNAYFAKLLQWNGSQPRLQSCLQCETTLDQIDPENELSCIIASAGWVCPKCRTQSSNHVRQSENHGFQQTLLKLTPRALSDFHLSLMLPIRQISSQVQASAQEHQALFKFLEALTIYHVLGFDQTPLKSLRFLGLESTRQPGAKNQQ